MVVREVGTDDSRHLVLGAQLGRHGGSLIGGVLVIGHHGLDRVAPYRTAGLLDRQIKGILDRLAECRHVAGERHDQTDLDYIGLRLWGAAGERH